MFSLRSGGRSWRGPLLAIAALLGGSAAAFWPLLGHRSSANKGYTLTNFTPTPIISLADAQKQVTFGITVPRELPATSQLNGVRVNSIRVGNLDEITQHVKSLQKPIYGYGVIVSLTSTSPQDHFYTVRSYEGSVAEKAGIPSGQHSSLIAVNGYPITFRGQDQLNSPDMKVRQAAAKRTRPVAELIKTKPLEITLKDIYGNIRTVSLASKGSFMGGAEMPELPPQAKQAALLYNAHGRQFALVEKVASDPVASFPSEESERLPSTLIGTHTVRLSGPSGTPSASWRSGGIDYWLNNNQGAIRQDELTRLIQSM